MSLLHKNNQRGYIALMSAIVISLILVALTFTLSTSGFFTRFNILDGEYKRVSLGLAESCVNAALLNVVHDYNYDPSGQTVLVGDESCVIESVTPHAPRIATSTLIQISTQASFHGAFSNMRITATAQNPIVAQIVPANLLVTAIVTNTYGGIQGPSDFPLFLNGESINSGQPLTLTPGAYTLTLAPTPPGYTTNSLWKGDCAPGGTITLVAGSSKSCAIYYYDVPTKAKLTLVANVINNNGGTKQPGDFQLEIDGVLQPSGVTRSGLAAPQTYSLEAVAMDGYTASSWSGDAGCSGGNIALIAGDNKTCEVNYDDNPPPSPACADTVMMLDKTGSMNSSELADERTAAKALLDLYASVTPKVGVGVFGDGTDDNGQAPASIVGHLTNSYASLYTAIDNWLSGGNGWTNLFSAISKSQAELETNGSYHDDGTPYEHVLIMLSDGDTNRPTANSPSDDLESPTADQQNAAGDSWINPAGVYSPGDAIDSGGHRHQFLNFGFGSPAGSGLPTGATVNGIEVLVMASSTNSATTQNIIQETFGTGYSSNDIANWDEEGYDSDSTTIAQAAGSDNDSASPDGGRFAKIYEKEWICREINATGFTGLKLSYFWRGDSDSFDTTDYGIVEYKAGSGSCSDTTGWQQLQNHDMRNSASWTAQSAFNLPVALENTTFRLRFRNSNNGSAGNEYFRVDGVTLSGVKNSTCQLGVDLSWNSGTSWSSESTKTLTTTSLPYTYGSATSKWGSHTWVSGDFTNARFRARIHELTAGPTCHVDSLQAKVYYTTPVDPVAAAYSAADNAKIAGTNIFTIFFSDDPGNPDLLARLASGLTPNAPHQNGSFNDPGGVVNSDTGYIAPTVQAFDTGGDNNGFEVNPTNAFADDSNFAANIDGAGDRHNYFSYNFNLPPGAQITGIEARPNWWLDSTYGTNSMGFQISWNGGTSWTSTKTDSSESIYTSHTTTLGGSTDLWGRTSWAAADFDPVNFRVRVTSNSNYGTRDFYLDYLPIRVYYTVIQENADNDNFYISPTSADMEGIFQAIGKKVCPAAVPPPPITSAKLNIITNVINDNGGIYQASDFHVTVSGANASPNSFDGSESGILVDVDAGSHFDIDQTILSGYNAPDYSSGCLAGTIAAGNTVTCVITNDDTAPQPPPPPPPPPAPPNIEIGTWVEEPTSPP